MPEKYEGLGISLLYPETWTLDEDQDAQGLTIETPSGSFLTISLCQDLQGAFDQARETMEKEYEEVEYEDSVLQLAHLTLRGITQRFVFLDLIVTSRLLTLETGDNKYLVQIQGEDRDLEQQQLVFDAILTSMCQSLAETPVAAPKALPDDTQ